MNTRYTEYYARVNGRRCRIEERVGDTTDPYDGDTAIIATANIWLCRSDGTQQLIAFVSSGGIWFGGQPDLDEDEFAYHCAEEEQDLHENLAVLGVVALADEEDV